MAASNLRLGSFKLLKSYHFCCVSAVGNKLLYCTTKAESEEPPVDKKLGFAKFSERQNEFLKQPKSEPETFASLLRNSEFINLGDPEGKEVIGVIYHVMENDLYIDFGWKFPTVCRRPEHNKDFYTPGTKVKLLIKDLELSSKFLGGDSEITLLEADCLLLGLLKPPSIEPSPYAAKFQVAFLCHFDWYKDRRLDFWVTTLTDNCVLSEM